MEIFDGGAQWTMAASMPSISGRVVPVVCRKGHQKRKIYLQLHLFVYSLKKFWF